MSPCNISCDLHDYIEIACLYGYQVKLTLKNQQSIEGKAVDIITADKREYLLIDNGEHQRIELTELAKMQVLTPNAQFTEMIF
ncbi:Modulator of Rho-dependent transcription termination [Crenothrix polyspora]|uniref:Modulator of Rho-dependent transcription termination n=1 Tax=Crenothrix polyspora TaxID=360316 RepID=A0A1R4H8Z3_9GAMM|nr:Rho-binding antiterminator [Crenothrix polyspora]SJM92666.1 Modulator of Rho-dependent transcription termination [Crenothrix polyspora]